MQAISESTSDLSAQPLVTAVLVCWNHVRFVRAAVESVLCQSFRNIQLIVFDNGSTDGSRDVLRSLADVHGFKLVLQDNIGLVRTLNRGLEMAQGKYFAVLATDDIWLPEKTRDQVNFFENDDDVHLTFGAVRTIDETGREFASVSGLGHYIGDVGWAELMASRKSVNGPTIMARTETLRKVGGYDVDLRIEDASLVFEFASKNLRVVGLPQALALYRRHGANWTATRPIWPDICAIGRKYCRNDYEYRAFVRRGLRNEFRRLAGQRKRDALRLLLSVPIKWTWNDVGIGALKLMTPKFLYNLRKRVIGDGVTAEPTALL